MATKPAETAQGAQTTKAFAISSLFKSGKSKISDDAVKGLIRDVQSVSTPTTKDIETLNFGTVNSSVRKGDIFRIVELKMVNQLVRQMPRKLLIAVVENPAGDQRIIYLSSLFRTVPQANGENNTYEDSVLNFNAGLLHNSAGMPTERRLELLAGDGTQFIHVSDEINYDTNAVRQQATAQDPEKDGNKVGDTFVIKNRVFQLEHMSEAEAIEASKA